MMMMVMVVLMTMFVVVVMIMVVAHGNILPWFDTITKGPGSEVLCVFTVFRV